jgi:hypothetical protein
MMLVHIKHAGFCPMCGMGMLMVYRGARKWSMRICFCNEIRVNAYLVVNR